MKKLSGVILSLLLLGIAPAHAQSNQDILKAYLSLKNDLIESNSQKAAKDVTLLKKSVSDSHNTDLIKAVDKMAKSNDINKQRKEFEEISTLVWATIKDDTGLNQTVYYQFCPMKKAYWISADEKIKNPYYGKQMLTCGKTVEKISK